MAKFRLSNKAVEDLSDIWNYTAQQWSVEQADRYYFMLVDACEKIAESPTLFGRRYDEISENLLGFKTNKHLIFYKTTEEHAVFVVRILHEQMDLKNRANE